MTVAHETEVRADSLDRLLLQYKEKPRLNSFIGVQLDQHQDLEDAFYRLYLDRALPNAVGRQLDRLGALLLQPRHGLSDEDFRTLLKGRILALQSSGTPDELLEILQVVLGDSTSITWFGRYPGAAVVRVDQDLGADAAIIETLLDTAKPAGPRLYFEYTNWPLADTFTLASGSTSETNATKGLGGVNYDTGGHLAGVQTKPGLIGVRVDGLGIIHDLRTGHVITQAVAGLDTGVLLSIDASGSLLHLENASGSLPQLVEDDPDFTGLRSLDFSGSASRLYNTQHVEFGTRYIRVFLRIKAVGTGAQILVDTIGQSNGGIRIGHINGDLYARIEDDGGTKVQLSAGKVDDGRGHTIEVAYDPDEGQLETFIDAVSQGTDDNPAMAGNPITSGSDFVLGSEFGGGNPWDGKFAALAVSARDNPLDQDELTRLRDAFGAFG